MRIYFFVLDEGLVDSDSREVERPAFRVLPASEGLSGLARLNVLIFFKKDKLTQSREDAKGLQLCTFPPQRASPAWRDKMF